MKGVSEHCKQSVLVLASVNKEISMVLAPGQERNIFPGTKTKVFSLRQSSENPNRKGWPEDPYKYYIVWKKGEEEHSVFAKEIRFDNFAGSSFNVADHLSSLGMDNLSLAAFVDDGPITKELSIYCQNNKKIEFVPLWASNTGITFVMEIENNPDAALCMEKPAAIDLGCHSSGSGCKNILWFTNYYSPSTAPADWNVIYPHPYKSAQSAVKTLPLKSFLVCSV